MASISLKEGEKATLDSPKREGYIFEGWYTDSSFTTVFDSTVAITKGITLYALWSDAPRTVSFVTNNEDVKIAPQTLAKGTKLSPPSNPPAKGTGLFLGWYTDEALTSSYDLEALVEEDLTLYAKYAAPYKLNFRWKIAQDVKDKLQETGTKITHYLVYLNTDGADKSRVPGTEAQWEIKERLIEPVSDGNKFMYSSITRYDTGKISNIQTNYTYEVLLKVSDFPEDAEGYMRHHFMLNQTGFKKHFSIAIVAVTDKNYLKEEQKDLLYANLFDAGNSPFLGNRYNDIEFMGFEGNLINLKGITSAVEPITYGDIVQQAGTEYDGWDRRIGLGTTIDSLDLKVHPAESPDIDFEVIRHPFYKATIVFPKGLDTARINPELSFQTTSEAFTINLSDLLITKGGVERDGGHLKGKLQNDVIFSHWHVLGRSSQYSQVPFYVLIPRDPLDANIFKITVCGFRAADPKQKPLIVEYAPSLEDLQKGGYTNICP